MAAASPSWGSFPTPPGIRWDQVIFKGLVIKGIYGREIFETWYKMQTMLQSGLDVSPVLTHRFPLARVPKGVSRPCSREAAAR